MGLNVCGVDMLRANHGPVGMEVNSLPFWKASRRQPESILPERTAAKGKLLDARTKRRVVAGL